MPAMQNTHWCPALEDRGALCPFHVTTAHARDVAMTRSLSPRPRPFRAFFPRRTPALPSKILLRCPFVLSILVFCLCRFQAPPELLDAILVAEGSLRWIRPLLTHSVIGQGIRLITRNDDTVADISHHGRGYKLCDHRRPCPLHHALSEWYANLDSWRLRVSLLHYDQMFPQHTTSQSMDPVDILCFYDLRFIIHPMRKGFDYKAVSSTILIIHHPNGSLTAFVRMYFRGSIKIALTVVMRIVSNLSILISETN